MLFVDISCMTRQVTVVQEKEVVWEIVKLLIWKVVQKSGEFAEESTWKLVVPRWL